MKDMNCIPLYICAYVYMYIGNQLKEFITASQFNGFIFKRIKYLEMQYSGFFHFPFTEY